MPGNLNRRGEGLFPIEAAVHKAYLRDDLLPLLLSDNVKARELGPDGVYRRRTPASDEPVVNAQEVLLATATALAPTIASANARPNRYCLCLMSFCMVQLRRSGLPEELPLADTLRVACVKVFLL